MKVSRLIEHQFIPLALISVNAALIHLLYLLTIKEDLISILVVILSLSLLTYGIIRKIKYHLIIGTAIYWLVLFYSLLFY